MTPASPTQPCKRCGADMHPGLAIENTLVGMPDFFDDGPPVTVHPGGTGKLIACMKCPRCGWSTT